MEVLWVHLQMQDAAEWELAAKQQRVPGQFCGH